MGDATDNLDKTSYFWLLIGSVLSGIIAFFFAGAMIIDVAAKLKQNYPIGSSIFVLILSLFSLLALVFCSFHIWYSARHKRDEDPVVNIQYGSI